jgi:hypothetical protein
MKNKREAPNPSPNPLQKQRKKLNESKKTPQAVQQATHAKTFGFSFRSIPFHFRSGFVQMKSAHPVTL